MLDILGIPMVGHVYHRSKMCADLLDVFVATPDKKILGYIESIGGKTVFTSDKSLRSTDRVAEALQIIEKEYDTKFDIVVMIQGDEPLVHPVMINAAVKEFRNSKDIAALNLMGDINTPSEHKDPNEIKVVVDKDNNALYFSREPIPSKRRVVGDVPLYKQVCVIVFSRQSLLEFNSLPQTPLEKAESIDMLRFLENGMRVKMLKINRIMCSVDTPADLEKADSYMRKDSLWQEGY